MVKEVVGGQNIYQITNVDIAPEPQTIIKNSLMILF
jgi:hypothetical protein